MKMKRFLLVVLSLLLLLAFMGCSDDTNNSSVTNPNPDKFNPKGTIQGRVLDSCTLQPISGAVINIGVATATTDADGQYTMTNVPATTYYDHTIGGEIDVELNWDEADQPYGGLELSEADLDILLAGETSGWIGGYSATIDMSKAKVVVDVNSATGKLLNLTKTTAVPVTQAPLKYANKYYNVVTVVFSSLKESDGNVSTVSNHDTPVDKVGTGMFNFNLGQLTSGISGDAVWGATYDAATGKVALMPVKGYAVALYTLTGEQTFGNSSTGSIGHRVALTTTNDAGHFSFSNLETARGYIIAVADGAPSKYAGYTIAHTMCDMDTLSFNIQDGKAIHVYSTDVVCPFVQLVTIDGKGPYVDLSKEEIADGVDIVLTFSEPIKATNLNTGRALLSTTDYLTGSDVTNALGGANTLYHDIDVNFVGYKSSNIPHTLAWNASMTALTIHIDAKYLQPASAYAIQILSGENLADENGNTLRRGVGHQDDSVSALPYDSASYDCADEISGSNWGIFFTTYGVIPASAVSDLKVMPVTPYTNARTTAAQLPYELDYDQEAKLDWSAVLGAKSYNLYCRMIQWNATACNNDPCDPLCTTTGQYHPYVLIDNIKDTSFWTNFQGKDSFFRWRFNMNEDNWEYVERDYVKLSYQCYVAGIDADGIEGPASNVVLIEDTVNPTIISTPTFAVGPLSSFQVCFSEPMNEVSVENAAWAINPAVLSNAANWDVDYWTTDTTFCAHFVFTDAVNLINPLHSTSANLVGTAANVAILSLGPHNIVDVAGNPLALGVNQLPIMMQFVYVSP